MELRLYVNVARKSRFGSFFIFLTVRSLKRGGFSFRPNLGAKNRDSGPRFY